MQFPVFTDEVTITGDGTEVKPLASLGSGATPGAPNHAVQFNNSGAFGGSSVFEFDPVAGTLAFAPTNANASWSLIAANTGATGALQAGDTGGLIIDFSITQSGRITIENLEPFATNHGIFLNSDSGAPSNNIQILCQDSGNNIQSSIIMNAAGDVSLNSFDGGTGFNDAISITEGNGINIGVGPTSRIGFYGQNGPTKQTITGAKLPGDTVLADLLTALQLMGLIVDSTT